MIEPRLRAHISWWRPIQFGLLLGISAALPAGAQTAGAAEPFVQDQYYLGTEGGEVVELADFFAAPMNYLRSETAYDALRVHFAETLGVDSLSPDEFQALFEEGKVRLTPCAEAGSFRTDGYVPETGAVIQSPRTTCYANEQFIELLVGETWMVVASQGCYNPIRLVTAPPPPPKPKEPVCRRVPMEVNVVPNPGVRHDGILHCGGGCLETMYTPPFTFNMGSTQSASGFVEICD